MADMVEGAPRGACGGRRGWLFTHDEKQGKLAEDLGLLVEYG
jgi:hypothetical protein